MTWCGSQSPRAWEVGRDVVPDALVQACGRTRAHGRLGGGLPEPSGSAVMRKGMWIGGALGLLALVALGIGASVWHRAGPGAAAPYPAADALATAKAPGAPQAAAVPAQILAPGIAGAQSAPQEAPSASNAADRRNRLAAVRAELSAIMAQGTQASPAQVQKTLDELEQLSKGAVDPGYFRVLRDMLESSAQVQELNRELQALTRSQDPKDAARRQAVLMELRVLSERIGAAAIDLQSQTRGSSAAQGKVP